MALTNKELSREIARRLRVSRVAGGWSQKELAARSGISVTSLARFEQTGAITLNNLLSVLRAMGLAQRAEDLIPDHEGPSPLELLDADRRQQKSAPGIRSRKRPAR